MLGAQGTTVTNAKPWFHGAYNLVRDEGNEHRIYNAPEGGQRRKVKQDGGLLSDDGQGPELSRSSFQG